MKTLKLFLAAMVLLLLSVAVSGNLYAGDNVKTKAFSALSVALEPSTYGIGVSLATPLGGRFSVSAGYNVSMPVKVSGSYEDFDQIDGIPVSIPALDLKGKINTGSGMVRVDFTPKKNGSFFIAAGLYIGGTEMLAVDGAFPQSFVKEFEKYGYNMSDIDVEIGDLIVHPNPDGSVSASLKTSAVKPYVGIGVGRAVPKKRVGVRFEVGGIFLGSPEMQSPNCDNIKNSDELGEINDLISSLKVYPKISLHLTVKLFNAK